MDKAVCEKIYDKFDEMLNVIEHSTLVSAINLNKIKNHCYRFVGTMVSDVYFKRHPEITSMEEFYSLLTNEQLTESNLIARDAFGNYFITLDNVILNDDNYPTLMEGIEVLKIKINRKTISSGNGEGVGWRDKK